MREYPKTENLFVRDPDTHQLVVGELRDPKHAQIKHWLVTEKVDGTNIRVLLRYFENHNGQTIDVQIRGRTAIAAWVNECRRDAPTLVHCQAGLNRSNLVAATALIAEGMEPADAIALLREKRSPAVLCNPAFEQMLLGT